jgi:hypothetical protein
MEEMKEGEPIYVVEIGENGFGGRIEVFEEPEADTEYVIGGDEAEGHNQDDKHDSSDACCLRCDNGAMAFHYTGKPSGEHFADDLDALSAHYNGAVLIPERTPLGGAVVNYLIKLGANLYKHHLGVEGAPEHTKFGFPANQRTKGLRDESLKTKLAQAAQIWEKYRNHKDPNKRLRPSDAAREVDCPVIRSVSGIKQLIHYANLKNKQRGGVGEHDDFVTSLGCAQYYRQEWVSKIPFPDWEEDALEYRPAYGASWSNRNARVG